MSAPQNEFPRPVRIDTIGDEDRILPVQAEADEREALARRFDLVAIGRLVADVRLRRTGETIHAEGVIDADVTQACVATGAPLPATLKVPFTLRFTPETAAPTQDEMELDAADCDTLFYTDGEVDCGEAVAETLYLALDPFPRAPDADEQLKASGALGEPEPSPFAALQALRDRLAE